MKNILPYRGILPQLDSSSFVASNAIISGDVKIGKNSGIWYGCVLRGDVTKIVIGENTNIQDNCVLHGTRPNHAQNKTGSEGAPVLVGSSVTIGHNAIIHACIIEDFSFIVGSSGKSSAICPFITEVYFIHLIWRLLPVTFSSTVSFGRLDIKSIINLAGIVIEPGFNIFAPIY